MIRLRLAVVGFGRLGRACATALCDCHDLGLAGVVRHGVPTALAPPLEHTPVAGHLRELQSVDTALVCVPAEQALGVTREILRQRVPVVECAILEGRALEAHHSALDVAAEVTSERLRPFCLEAAGQPLQIGGLAHIVTGDS